MSAALPYLQKLRKSELTEFAQASRLHNYEGMKKADLEVALDEHLRANQSTYGSEAVLSDYYKRLGPRSPAKKVTEMVKAEGDVVVKKGRRKTTAALDQAGAATANAEASSSALVKTPASKIVRASTSLAQSIPLPPSPAVVTDVIDRQTRRLGATVSNLYAGSGVHEFSDSARDILSSPYAITAIALVVEAYGLRKEILPSKAVGDIPAIPFVKGDKTTVYVPDLFLLLDKSFWAPFSLWSLTSLLIPLTVAYFINIPHKASPAHTHGRRAVAAQGVPSMQFDPLVFNVAKALVAYVVYAQHFDFLGLFQHYTITTVNENVIGGYFGMVTGAGVAGVIALYEAVLKK